MELTKKQEQALEIAIQRYKDHCKYTVIAGFAGTGKSTTVKFIIEALYGLGIAEDDVCFAAFTGKASQVLARKGNKHTSTLHKLLYNTSPLPNGKFVYKPKDSIEYKVVVVDEISMAPKTLMDLLFEHDVYVIALGDPFQLPTIHSNEDNHLLDNPHIFLDEIMRQATESEIIRMTMDIRNMQMPAYSKGDEVMVLPRGQISQGMLTWADQILVATNAMRNDVNAEMRKMQGFSEVLQVGDKLVCARNYWEELSDNDNPLVNGTIGIVEEVDFSNLYIPVKLGGQCVPIANVTLNSDGERYKFALDVNMLVTGKPTLSPQEQYRIGRAKLKNKIDLPRECLYGYAITCHRAQGSEFSRVLVIEERFPFEREEHARWLYTAATRAESKLVLLR